MEHSPPPPPPPPHQRLEEHTMIVLPSEDFYNDFFENFNQHIAVRYSAATAINYQTQQQHFEPIQASPQRSLLSAFQCEKETSSAATTLSSRSPPQPQNPHPYYRIDRSSSPTVSDPILTTSTLQFKRRAPSAIHQAHLDNPPSSLLPQPSLPPKSPSLYTQQQRNLSQQLPLPSLRLRYSFKPFSVAEISKKIPSPGEEFTRQIFINRVGQKQQDQVRGGTDDVPLKSKVRSKSIVCTSSESNRAKVLRQEDKENNSGIQNKSSFHTVNVLKTKGKKSMMHIPTSARVTEAVTMHVNSGGIQDNSNRLSQRLHNTNRRMAQKMQLSNMYLPNLAQQELNKKQKMAMTTTTKLQMEIPAGYISTETSNNNNDYNRHTSYFPQHQQNSSHQTKFVVR